MSRPKRIIRVASITVLCLIATVNARPTAQPAPGYSLAFIWAVSLTEEIYPYLIDSDGSNGTALKKAYPPTGCRGLAYTCNVGEGTDICTIDADGSNPRHLCNRLVACAHRGWPVGW